MSSKKNLPNIPIYIGDWERDCNVLSLEAEAAWMRIVFKLWTKGKQNTIKIPTKSIQNLWRCSSEKMIEIIEELQYNDICEMTVSDRFIEFTCRRFVKENKISGIRSNASKGKNKNKKQTKANQIQNKSKSNTKQNTDNEIEYVNEIDIEFGDKNEILFNREIFEKEFTDLISEYFLQTTEAQKMKVNGFLKSDRIKPQIDHFKGQTNAYIEYKKLTEEKIHNWLSFQTEWDREDWIRKLQREKLNKARKGGDTDSKMNEKVKEKVKQYD